MVANLYVQTPFHSLDKTVLFLQKTNEIQNQSGGMESAAAQPVVQPAAVAPTIPPETLQMYVQQLMAKTSMNEHYSKM